MSVQPERQITSSIDAEGGGAIPLPPVVRAPDPAGRAMAAKTAAAVSTEDLARLLLKFSFGRACGVSWRARAERVALRSGDAFDSPLGLTTSLWFLRLLAIYTGSSAVLLRQYRDPNGRNK